MENKKLSILLRSDGFSFCISDDAKEISLVKEILFGQASSPQDQLELIQKAFESEPALATKFHSILVIHSSNLSTFVPKPFFKKENLADYLHYNLKVLQNDFIAFDPVDNGEMMNVYIPSVHLNNYFFDAFGSFEYKHSSTVLVESLLKKSSKNDAIQFYVHVENEQFQIVVVKRKKLLFFNSFNFKTKEDFIYYILFTAEQLHLNPEEFNLILLGEIKKGSDLYLIVYKHVRYVEFLSPKHANFILLNQ